MDNWVVFEKLDDVHYATKEAFPTEQAAKEYVAKEGKNNWAIKEYTRWVTLSPEEAESLGYYCVCSGCIDTVPVSA